MKTPFKIQAKGKAQEVDVFIFGDIGASWWDENAVEAAKFVKDLQALDATTINVRINSYGGSVSDGIAIYNALRRHPANRQFDRAWHMAQASPNSAAVRLFSLPGIGHSLQPKNPILTDSLDSNLATARCHAIDCAPRGIETARMG